MEFFVCPCPATGNVILDGDDQGPNKDSHGNLLTKQCNEGEHCVSLQFADGRRCVPDIVLVEICETDPIAPQKVPFRCE